MSDLRRVETERLKAEAAPRSNAGEGAFTRLGGLTELGLGGSLRLGSGGVPPPDDGEPRLSRFGEFTLPDPLGVRLIDGARPLIGLGTVGHSLDRHARLDPLRTLSSFKCLPAEADGPPRGAGRPPPLELPQRAGTSSREELALSTRWLPRRGWRPNWGAGAPDGGR